MARKRPDSELVRALQTTGGPSYRQCEWTSDGRQCMYPGTISTNTHEGGPWFCHLHFGCDSAAYGASVVQASQDYRHPTQEELDAEHLERARASLKAKGLDRQPGESIRDWMNRTTKALGGKLEPTVKKFEDAA